MERVCDLLQVWKGGKNSHQSSWGLQAGCGCFSEMAQAPASPRHLGRLISFKKKKFGERSEPVQSCFQSGHNQCFARSLVALGAFFFF